MDPGFPTRDSSSCVLGARAALNLEVIFNSSHVCLGPNDAGEEPFSWLVRRLLNKAKRELLPKLKNDLKLPDMDSGEREPLNSGTKVGRQAVTMEAQASMCAQTSFHAITPRAVSDPVTKKGLSLTSESIP